MSNEKQETIADIVAEMRNESHAGDASCLEWVGAKIRGYADRIEAAMKREREATSEKSSVVANAAKMREALSGLLEIVCIDCKSPYEIDGKCVKCPRVVAAEAALSAPPRNCDVGTAYAQAKRHKRWCDSHTCRSTYSCALCFAKWANKPYKEGGAK